MYLDAESTSGYCSLDCHMKRTCVKKTTDATKVDIRIRKQYIINIFKSDTIYKKKNSEGDRLLVLSVS